MRLINADDMIKSLMDMTYYDEEGYTIHDYEDRLAIVKDFVDSVPTVDAEPIRHGKWLSREEGCLYPFWERYTCSECGKHADDTKYCPYCGAKMDVEREEE